MLCTQLPQPFHGNAMIFHGNFYGNFIQNHFQLFIKICEDMKISHCIFSVSCCLLYNAKLLLIEKQHNM